MINKDVMGSTAAAACLRQPLATAMQASLLVLLAACSAESPNEQTGADPSSAEQTQPTDAAETTAGNGKDIRPAMRRVVTAAIAGTYDQHCNNLAEGQLGPVPGERIVLTPDGKLESSTAGMDFIDTMASGFGFQLSRPDASFSAVLDLQDATSYDRIMLIGVQQYDGLVAAQFTDTRQAAELSRGCTGTVIAAFAMNLWDAVTQHIEFAPVTAQCFAIPAADKGTVRIALSDGILSVDNERFDRSQHRLTESLNIGSTVDYGFSIDETASYTLSVDPDGSFQTLLVSKNGEHYGCS